MSFMLHYGDKLNKITLPAGKQHYLYENYLILLFSLLCYI
jgi:hypothetical protein